VSTLKERDPRKAFGQALRHIRERKRLSQEKLAELAGIHRTYVGDVERGVRNIALINMNRLASALGIPLKELVGEMERIR